MTKGKTPNPMHTMLHGVDGERPLSAEERRQQRRREREAEAEEKGGGEAQTRRSGSRGAAASAVGSAVGAAKDGPTDHAADDRILKWVDPDLIAIFDHHDREYSRLTAMDCGDIIETLPEGQKVPASVRPLTGSDQHRYELVAGARRHWSASYLKLPLLVEVKKNLSDKEAFELNQVDNLAREDVAPIERGRTYAWAEAFYDSHVAMAQALGIDRKILRRHLALALLPAGIFEAYGDDRHVPSAHAEVIEQLIAAHGKDAVVEAARRLGAQYSEAGSYPRPAGVLTQLKKAFEQPGDAQVVKREHEGRTLAQGRRKSARHVQLDLYLDTGANADDLRAQVNSLIGDFVES